MLLYLLTSGHVCVCAGDDCVGVLAKWRPQRIPPLLEIQVGNTPHLSFQEILLSLLSPSLVVRTLQSRAN